MRETVKKGEAVADWGGVVPGFSLTVPVWQRLIQVRAPSFASSLFLSIQGYLAHKKPPPPRTLR